MVLNLISNALKFTASGQVALSAAVERRDETSDCIAIEVHDTGIGITSDQMQRLFASFSQADASISRRFGGTGLGLATVYGIVGQHQGWIEVESAVGRGTTVRVYLPAADAAISATKTGVSAGAVVGGHEGVLIVEDNEGVRRLLCTILQHLGYRVVEAVSGDEAVRLWPSIAAGVDVVITDMVMPGSVDGRELARRLRHEKPALKVMISSGYSSDMAEVVADAEPGVTFLPKPYQVGTLAQALRQCLDAK